MRYQLLYETGLVFETDNPKEASDSFEIELQDMKQSGIEGTLEMVDTRNLKTLLSFSLREEQRNMQEMATDFKRDN